MRLIRVLIIFLDYLLISSLNLRNFELVGEQLISKSDKFEKLTQAANQTFYQLYELLLDFKERYYLEIDDDTKFLRVIINENINSTIKEESNSFEFKNAINLSEEFEIPDNISITIFGRTFNLKDEFWNIVNSIFRYTDIISITFPKENLEKFDSISKYLLTVKDNIGSIDVILEDKDDKVSIEDNLEIFWDSVKNILPNKYIHNTRLAAEFVVITFGIRRAVSNRREKLIQIANETFYELYNISLDFKGKNMITVNQDEIYYKVLINEYPKNEGSIFTRIDIQNSRIFFTDFPLFSSLTFKIFGRTYNLKEEFLSIVQLIAPIIKEGSIRIEKMNLDKFDSQITSKYELFRENEETQGGFEIIFEDKDDKIEIERTLNDFWKTWSNQIPPQDAEESKLIAQFVVTHFGIWHNIQNRYDKIVSAAKESLYQLLNITIDFQGRYIYNQNNGIYELVILIDEYPLEPTDVATYFNITNGRAFFPDIITRPDFIIKLNISNNLFDVEEEFRAFGSIFAAGIRNGKVVFYYKSNANVSNTIRFKCFINSQNNEEYGSFEISLKYIEKTLWQKIKDGVSNFWSQAKAFLGEVNEGLKIASEIAANVNAIQKTIMNITNPHSSSSSSSYLSSKILLIILSNLLFLIIL